MNILQYLFKKSEFDESTRILRIENSGVRASKFAKFADLAQSKIFVGGGVLVISGLMANVLNFLYNAYLGRRVALEDFGIIGLIGSLLYISYVPLGALGRAVTHKSAYLFGKYEHPVRDFWLQLRHKSFIVSLVVAGIWLLLSPFMATYFRTPDMMPFILLTPVWVIGTLTCIDGGYLNGNLDFQTIAILAVTEAAAKLICSIILVELGYVHLVYVAIPASMFVAFLIGWKKAYASKYVSIEPEDRNIILRFPKRFFVTSILTTLTSITYLSLDVILAKHYLAPSEAGLYSFLTLAGKMVYFIGTLFSQFTVPLVSRNMGAGQESQGLYFKILGFVFVVNCLAFVIFGVYGYIVVPLLWGRKAELISPYLLLYTFAMAAYSLSSVIIAYHQVKARFIFPIAGFLLGSIQTVGIVFYHDSIWTFTKIIATSASVSLLSMILMDRFYPVIEILIGRVHPRRIV